MVSAFPQQDAARSDPKAEEEIDQLIALVRSVRNIRAQLHIDAAKHIDALVDPRDHVDLVREEAQAIRALARLGSLELSHGLEAAPGDSMVTVVAGQVVVGLPLGDVIDLAGERQRLSQELQESFNNLKRVENLLSNGNFTAKAPDEVVERERARAAVLKERSQRLQEILAQLPE
jgi:valyl-tRNA synthetase